MKKRIEYLDIARGLAVLTMFLQHSIILFDINGGEEGILGLFMLLVGTAPAAPVFMLILGVFFAKSNLDFKSSILRGLKILLLGYTLNFMRFYLPLSILNQLNYVVPRSMPYLLAVDILQLAGCSIIIMTILKSIIKDTRIYVILALSILISSPFLWTDKVFLQLISGSLSETYFPLLPWLYYPLLGFGLSRYFTKEKFRSKEYIHIAFLLLALALILLAARVGPIGDYYRSGAGIHMLITSFIFLWFSFCYYISNSLNNRRFLYKKLITWSKDVTIIYFIQWLVFAMLLFLLGENRFSSFESLMLSIVVIILTDYIRRVKILRKFIECFS